MGYLVSPRLDGDGAPVDAEPFGEAFTAAFSGISIGKESTPGGDVVCLTLEDGGQLRLSADGTELWADVGSLVDLARAAGVFRSLVPASVTLRLAHESLESALPVESTDASVVLAGLELVTAWWTLLRVSDESGAPVRSSLRHGRIVPANVWRDGRVPVELMAMHSCHDGLDPRSWTGIGPPSLFPGSGAFDAFPDDAPVPDSGLWPLFGAGTRWWIGSGPAGEGGAVYATYGDDLVPVDDPAAAVVASVVAAFVAGRFAWVAGDFTAFGADPADVVREGLRNG